VVGAGASSLTVPDDGRNAITVVVGHFYGLVRHGLSEALRQNRSIDVLATDVGGAALEHTVSRLMPQVVIVDDVVEQALLMQLKSNTPAPGVLVLSAGNPSRLYRTLLEGLGVICLAQTASTEDILVAIQVVAGGEIPSPGTNDNVADHVSSPPHLTRREEQVFAYLRQGKTYAEIGLSLHIAYETVRTHSMRVCKKLGVRSRLDLIGMPFPRGPESAP
jgi:DNA-binding NarL/FixJ family response regulator